MTDRGTSPAEFESPRRRTSRTVKIIAGAAMVGLLAAIVVEGRSLWNDLEGLRAQNEEIRRTDVIGYLDVHPDVNYAQPPANWIHDEGDGTMLWAGWKGGEHSWFRVARGELSRDEISRPIGRDTLKAIDHPIVETLGGPVSGRIPGDSAVAVLEMGAVHRSYPVLVLQKVLVVNDEIDGMPLLISYNPYAEKVEPAGLFDPMLDGRRITLGHSGYLLGHQPILYDRGTQSFWVERAAGLVAIAGPHRGATLRRMGRLDDMAWSEWRAQHADGVVLVGADRSKPRPAL